MSLSPTADPAELGFDPARLTRIERHFAKYVDSELLPGFQVAVTRHGEVAYTATYGLRDKEAGAPVEDDTLWRIYSMTKPITSVAAMSLWEEGRFELTDEISRYIPEFADVRVYDKGSSTVPFTVPAAEPVRIWHLLTHTSGLTYGFFFSSVVDAIYRQAGFDVVPEGYDLAEGVRRIAKLPLLFQPGTRWGYGVSTDVLGRVLEVVAGKPLDEVIAERVLGPLKMTETTWWVEPERAHRLAGLYAPHPVTGHAVRHDVLGHFATEKPDFLAGGAGLVSTAADYHRFTQMLLRGGEVDGVRVLGSRTLAWMTRNHLPGGQDLGTLSSGGFAETNFEGVGFGLGFAVGLNTLPSKTLASVGEFYWGGMASTAFVIDPAEEITILFFTQLVPSSRYPLRPQLRQLVYQALVD